MPTILVPVKGEVVYATQDPFISDEFLKETGRNIDELNYPNKTSYCDPTSVHYCWDEYRLWVLTKHLSQGLILVGVDGQSWIFVKPENIVGGS